MLKGIPAILPPELLKILMERGPGDELLLADANSPRLGQPERVIRCDGHGIPELIAIAVVIGLHLWKKQMLLSIAGGTVCYMLLVQFVF